MNILELLKTAIKTKDIQYVEQAFELLTGKKYITNEVISSHQKKDKENTICSPRGNKATLPEISRTEQLLINAESPILPIPIDRAIKKKLKMVTETSDDEITKAKIQTGPITPRTRKHFKKVEVFCNQCNKNIKVPESQSQGFICEYPKLQAPCPYQ